MRKKEKTIDRWLVWEMSEFYFRPYKLRGVFKTVELAKAYIAKQPPGDAFLSLFIAGTVASLWYRFVNKDAKYKRWLASVPHWYKVKASRANKAMLALNKMLQTLGVQADLK